VPRGRDVFHTRTGLLSRYAESTLSCCNAAKSPYVACWQVCCIHSIAGEQWGLTLTKQRGGGSAREPGVTWAQAARDVVLRAMDTGQLPFVALWFVALLILLKMPSAEMMAMIHSLIGKLEHGELISYILLLVSWAGWYVHAKTMRAQHVAECSRIGQEKSKLQNVAANHQFPSSRRS